MLRKGPILCFYYLTYRCNARCRYCDIWRREDLQDGADASLRHIEANLRQLRNTSVRFIDFTGGEPLLFDALPAALYEAKKLGFLTTVTTNAILYEERGAEIRGLVDFLHFSLDGLDPDLHDSLRGRPCHRQVLAAIETARRLGERPDLLFTATERNYREVSALVQFAQRCKLVLIINPAFGDSATPGREAMRTLDRCRGLPFVYVNRAFSRLRYNGGNQRGAPRCRAVTASLVISPDNEILLPCFHHAVARIAIDDNLAAAMASATRLRALKMQGRYDFCQGCAINCYFDPSFLCRLDGFFVDSQIAKAKYAVDKYLRAGGARPRLWGAMLNLRSPWRTAEGTIEPQRTLSKRSRGHFGTAENAEQAQRVAMSKGQLNK